MTWIRIIEPTAADGRLAKIYQRLAGGGQVDNILIAHSLRPHTLEGHMALYRAVLGLGVMADGEKLGELPSKAG